MAARTSSRPAFYSVRVFDAQGNALDLNGVTADVIRNVRHDGVCVGMYCTECGESSSWCPRLSRVLAD